MVGTEQHDYLTRLYKELLPEPTCHTSHTQHLKGAWAIHRLCEVAQFPVELTNIPQTNLGLFKESAASLSAT